MLINEFVEHWCKLNETQGVVMHVMLAQNRVIGVARAIGGIEYCPLISFGRMPLNVIDGAGYYQLASKDGMKFFDPITEYYTDRQNYSGRASLSN